MTFFIVAVLLVLLPTFAQGSADTERIDKQLMQEFVTPVSLEPGWTSSAFSFMQTQLPNGSVRSVR